LALLYRALAGADVSAFADTWTHPSPVHTPLVPFGSAILMLVFGESRVVAESIMPIFTAMWLVATYLVISRLYDAATAKWTTALASVFPVFRYAGRLELGDGSTVVVLINRAP
jgi:hypothetical protein